jgi:hypothetical protein
MVESSIALNLLLTFKVDKWKMFEYIDMLLMCIWYQLYSVIHALLGSDNGDPGSLVESKGYHFVMVQSGILFKLLPAFIVDRKCLSTLICSP